MLNEAQAIDQVRAGRADAFAEIVERYQAPIFRYLLRMTGDYQVAQDLAQDTFLNAYESILKTRAELSLKAWLYRIATNNALKFHRRRRLLSFVPFAGTEGSNTPRSTSSLDAKIAIEEALLQVPAERRICLVLHFVEGLRYREIAEIVGANEDAVRKRVTKGRKELRGAYGTRSGGDMA